MDPARGWWTIWSNVRMEGIAEDEWLPTFWHWTSSQKWTQDESLVIDNKTDTTDLWFKGKQLILQQQKYVAVDKCFSTWFLLPVYWTVIARGNAIMADFALCWVMLCRNLFSVTPTLWVGKYLSEKRWCELCALLAPAGSTDLDQHLSVWKRYKSDCSLSANCQRFLMHSWSAASLTPHKSCNRSGLYQVCLGKGLQ